MLADQLRKNAVALISLALAMITLGYTTWRNETTETQRSVRTAAFQSLEALAELQVIVDARQYHGDRLRGDYIAGWKQVQLIDDLSMLLPTPAPVAALGLHETWQGNFAGWYDGSDPEAEKLISRAIRATRDAIVQVLADLD